MLRVAVEGVELSVQELGQKLRDDEQLADLWLRGCEYAMRAANERKRNAFAAILAGAVAAEHQDRLRHSAFVDVVESLEEEHIALLDVIKKAAAPPTKSTTFSEPRVSEAELARRLPQFGPALHAVLAGLVRYGLVTDAPSLGLMAGGKVTDVMLTPLGAAVHDHLRTVT